MQEYSKHIALWLFIAEYMQKKHLRREIGQSLGESRPGGS